MKIQPLPAKEKKKSTGSQNKSHKQNYERRIAELEATLADTREGARQQTEANKMLNEEYDRLEQTVATDQHKPATFNMGTSKTTPSPPSQYL